MKAVIALLAAALGLYASLAWSHEAAQEASGPPAAASAEPSRAPRTITPGGGQDFGSRPTRPQPRVVPPRNPLPHSEPAILCACTRLAHQA
jgi:hypothetical protein